MNAKSTPTARRYDLDWLRVLAILSVFVYHSTRFFNLGDWHVKNAVTYVWVQLWDNFATTWLMPFIFVISGASLYFAMEKGGFAKFLKDKVLRLLVPLLVGAFTHASLQVYLERLTHGQFSGSYFEFLPHYFQGVYMEGDPAAGNFAFAGMHLWYLMFLFMFVLVLYPVFRGLKTKGGQAVLAKIGGFLALPGAMYLLAIPLILIDDHVNGFIVEITPGGWGMAFYMWFLLAGFILISHAGLQERIRRMRWISLTGAILLSAGFLVIVVMGQYPAYAALSESIDDLLRSFASWFWIFSFLGFASQHLSFKTPFLKYANEAVLPFYILHQTVLLGLGYFVVQWHIPDLLKWIIILTSSFPVIMGLYEYGVRRNNVLRFLFGMKPKEKAPASQTVLQPAPSQASSD